MQDSLFDDVDPSPRMPLKGADTAQPEVQPAPADAARRALAAALPKTLHLGTSSWHFPGWAGLVWEGHHEPSVLSKRGLAAYAQHPLLRTVSLDRTFYRPISASQFAAYAAMVPDDFRFVVKAPSLVTDAMVRDEDGRGQQPNPAFLDATLSAQQFVQPALDGLGHKIGALVFQLSPLPGSMLAQLPEILRRLREMLAALPPLRDVAPDGVIAVEVRNPAFLTPAFAEILRDAGATYCLGLHAKMPPVEEQLPMLRALWPGPLVCRWSLHRRHGAYGYESARSTYEPFDRIVDEDAATRDALARVIVATVAAGHTVYLTVNNKAEGSAPLSVEGLARLVAERLRAR